MYEKIKLFIKKHKYITVVFIMLAFVAMYMFCSRENLYDNRKPINDIRNELTEAQKSKSDITDTAQSIDKASTDLENSIKEIRETSTNFDAILDECTSIIEQIRSQYAK